MYIYDGVSLWMGDRAAWSAVSHHQGCFPHSAFIYSIVEVLFRIGGEMAGSIRALSTVLLASGVALGFTSMILLSLRSAMLLKKTSQREFLSQRALWTRNTARRQLHLYVRGSTTKGKSNPRCNFTLGEARVYYGTHAASICRVRPQMAVGPLSFSAPPPPTQLFHYFSNQKWLYYIINIRAFTTAL